MRGCFEVLETIREVEDDRPKWRWIADTGGKTGGCGSGACSPNRTPHFKRAFLESVPYFVGIMGKVYESLTPALREWIEKQKVFFVATAPLSGEGHINCSPKGLDTFRVIGDREVAYLDLTGSGIETIAHLRENGRIVILFCAFEGPPLIVRLHGKGEVVYPGDVAFSDLMKHFPENAGTRAILRVRVTRVSDSCGFGVPLYEFAGPRDVLDRFAETKGPEGLTDYRREVNRRSIDGLPAYEG